MYEIDLPVPGLELRKAGKTTRGIDVSGVLADYAAVAAQAAQAGRAVEYTVRVTPDGRVEVVDRGDALDAAMAAARRRGQHKVAEILKGSDMLSARDFGDLLGVSHETVNVRRRRGEILGLQGATRVVRYPRWQVSDAGTIVPGLAQLSALLGQPWSVYRFLLTAHPELDGQTALAALGIGRQEDVLDLARNQKRGTFS